ncbi:MAG: PRC-barrel domain-containing protein [Hyphomicrobiaceae bacterium]
MKWIIPAATSMVLVATSAGIAQTTPPSETPPPAVTAPSVQPTTPTQAAPMLTEEQAKALINATVLSRDNKNVGTVAAIQRDSDGKVIELHANVGGFLGIGQTRVRILPSQFTVTNDNKIQLDLSADQVGNLPKIES